MPLVKIHLRKRKTPEYIRAVADAVHDTLVTRDDVMVNLVEVAKENGSFGRGLATTG
ncbi:MAG TPA: hypothetical protein VH087_18645 [Thermoanaerobaculia bacterium]|jgi:hypothetical protein|nr:hypothetical protein [Thermoanaerobaculia bacterium]